MSEQPANLRDNAQKDVSPSKFAWLPEWYWWRLAIAAPWELISD
ncbi:hypothetical protein [Coleofasciculus chthonoplastes]|nr:hypothetical protein [Coleofasciculus chthonoplastes]